jgi:hypothetical protein
MSAYDKKLKRAHDLITMAEALETEAELLRKRAERLRQIAEEMIGPIPAISDL